MKTCLVVDDSEHLRAIVGKIVATLGFSVREAADGMEALTICRGGMPDAILLDWHMPVMNGLEFLRALANEVKGALPPIIFCTGESSVKHINDAISAGASDYVLKPFDREILAERLRGAGLIPLE